MTDPDAPFVPEDFVVPEHLHTDAFDLVPLGAEHNDRDYAAWMSSIDHIRATPGFDRWKWPHPMPLEANLADLVRHAGDFTDRRGFTFTVLDPDEDVIGCVYIYPGKVREDGEPAPHAQVRSWVRESRAELDVPLWRAVSAWLASSWPFESVAYASR